MKILLIQPPRKDFLSDFWEPLGLETIAAELHDHDIALCCPNFPNITVEGFLGSGFNFDLAALTGFGVDEPKVHYICKKIREVSPRTKVVVGGWWASTFPHVFFNPLVDFIVCGEGELTFAELIQYLEKNESLSEIQSVKGLYYQADDGFFYFTGKRPLIDLTTLNPPRRDLFAPYRKQFNSEIESMGIKKLEDFRSPYLAQTARGCNHRCRFCSVWTFFGGRVRRKSMEQLERELSAIPNNAHIKFVDDNFLMSTSAVLGIVDLLKRKNYSGKFECYMRADDIAENSTLIEALAGVGLKNAVVGFETFEEGDPYSKDVPFEQHEKAISTLHQNGILVQGSFLIDPRAWGVKDFREFADYVRKSKIDFPRFNILTPLPGTELYKSTRRAITSNEKAEIGGACILPTKLRPEIFQMELTMLKYLLGPDPEDTANCCST